jgi:hypothetical protein
MDKYSCEYGVPNLLLTKPHEQRSSGAKKKNLEASGGSTKRKSPTTPPSAKHVEVPLPG